MDELPQLPPTSWVDVPHFTYTERHMRAYAAAAVAQAIEACAKLCDPSNADRPDDWTEYAKVRAECAAAIRATLPRE